MEIESFTPDNQFVKSVGLIPGAFLVRFLKGQIFFGFDIKNMSVVHVKA